MNKEEETRILEEIERIEKEDLHHRKRITEVFNETGIEYASGGLALYNIHQGHDVHAFYMLSFSPVHLGSQDLSTKTIHVQGYPGMSN